MATTDFDRWVSQNSIPEELEYGKGWWDYVELVQRFADKHDIDDVRVIGRYVVHTPPPEEELPMPAVALTGSGAVVPLQPHLGQVKISPGSENALLCCTCSRLIRGSRPMQPV